MSLESLISLGKWKEQKARLLLAGGIVNGWFHLIEQVGRGVGGEETLQESTAHSRQTCGRQARVPRAGRPEGGHGETSEKARTSVTGPRTEVEPAVETGLPWWSSG